MSTTGPRLLDVVNCVEFY